MLIVMLDALTSWLQPWADVYAESSWLSTTLVTVHVVAMFLGGGIAIGADRQLLGQRHPSPALLRMLTTSHQWVIAGLSVTILSGLALATADLGTFAVSWVFWTKMALILGLLINGVRMRREERRLLVRDDVNDAPAGSSTDATGLQQSAWLSLSGWVLVVGLGVVLSNG